MEGEWSCYRSGQFNGGSMFVTGGHFNGGRMVMLQKCQFHGGRMVMLRRLSF